MIRQLFMKRLDEGFKYEPSGCHDAQWVEKQSGNRDLRVQILLETRTFVVLCSVRLIQTYEN